MERLLHDHAFHDCDDDVSTSLFLGQYAVARFIAFEPSLIQLTSAASTGVYNLLPQHPCLTMVEIAKSLQREYGIKEVEDSDPPSSANGR
ncbi:hypothetical protein TIFTF001_030438 [Ficus carica]|uniref:Uncharacterized protein n=1 Tax=Ficus carica TaxID=3494 RepID=A0AA88DXK2_FICCA|nr:hypothetical protein TIFTF001_030438 [Ficus carica]